MSEGSILKKLSDKLVEWDKELDTLKAKAASTAGDQKVQFERMSADIQTQTAQVRAKIDELKNKSPDEIKAQAEDLLRIASGKISEGLQGLAQFFDSKARKPQA